MKNMDSRPHVVIVAKKRLMYNTRIQKQALSLVRHGYKVTVVCLQPPLEPPATDLVTWKVVEFVTPLWARNWLDVRAHSRRWNRISGRIRRFTRRSWAQIRRRVLYAVRHGHQFARHTSVRMRRRLSAWRVRVRRQCKWVRIRMIGRLPPPYLRWLRALKGLWVRQRYRVSPSLVQGHQGRGQTAIDAIGKIVLSIVFFPLVLIRALRHVSSRQRAFNIVNTETLPTKRVGIALVNRVAVIFLGRIRRATVRIRRELLNIHQQVMSSVIRLATSLEFSVKSLRICLTEKGDIYVSHDSYPLIISFIASKLNRSILVYDAVEFSRDRNTGRKSGRLSRALEDLAIKSCDAVLTVGDYLAELIRETWGASNVTVVMNCPYYVPKNAALEIRDLGVKERKVFLYVGSVTANYGLEEVVLAMDYVDDPDISVVIMGPVTNMAFARKLEKLVASIENRKRVYVLPPQSPSLVVRYAMSAYAGILAIKPKTMNQRFALPNKLFDYIMARLPIIASPLPNVQKFVDELGIGIVLTDVSAPQIAQAMLRLSEDKDLYARVKANVDEVAEWYSWEHQEAKMVNLFQRLLPVSSPHFDIK